MKFYYNSNFTLPKQSQRSRSILQDGSRSLGLFWKEKTLFYNRRNMVKAVLMINAAQRMFLWRNGNIFHITRFKYYEVMLSVCHSSSVVDRDQCKHA